MRRSAALVLLAFACWDPAFATAFRGCAGFGCDTPGGRRGRVLFVTSLADSGPGTLREAIETCEPRLILPRVAGYVTLERPLTVSCPFVTIDARTAPGSGLTVRNKLASPKGAGPDSFPALVIRTHDVVLRGLAIRPGVWKTVPQCTRPDALGPRTCRDAGDVIGIHMIGASRVVLDHLSVSHVTDELVLVQDSTDVTVSWTIGSSGYVSPTPYCGWGKAACDPWGGKGLAGYGNTTRVSTHHNLWAHVAARCPQIIGTWDERYSVVYNWREHGVEVHNRHGKTLANVVGVRTIPGPETKSAKRGVIISDWRGKPGGVSPGPLGVYIAEIGNTSFSGSARLFVRRFQEPVPAPPVGDEGDALEHAGAMWRLDATGQLIQRRDAIDARVVAEVRARNGRAPRHTDSLDWPKPLAGQPFDDQDRDGLPDEWERERGLEVTVPDGQLDPDGDGFTHLDDFLSGRAPRA